MLLIVDVIGRGHTGDVWVTILQGIVGAGVYFWLILLLRDRQMLEILKNEKVDAILQKLKGKYMR